ncbi:MAG: hypothetical protein AMQ22_00231 [Candidatus Methanofastidiosum methylothiophilum]|uniref:Uncharacterized protein n=1 Tax=Candidatus Methanofastidiosum methylothiophilum TaxID=1705564 RepID=A0A150J8M5_9EURY|nr:MAG: hypothetical protein AMQ22_00231 [Candidatus Methanofastidiosum methylthiophilus]
MAIIEKIRDFLGLPKGRYVHLPRRERRRLYLAWRRTHKHPFHKNHFGNFRPIMPFFVNGRFIPFSWYRG